jgi:hypothetical protein
MRITDAATVAWRDIKKAFPLFGEIESFINKIGAGNWKGAFLQIWKAATDVWATIKKAVPFFGGVELLVDDIKKGDWKGAFDIISEAAKTVSNTLFGENMTTRLQAISATAVAQFNLLKDTLLKPGGAIALIQDGLTKLGSGDVTGGFSGIITGIQTAITQANAAINAWVLSNFGINIPGLQAAANSIATQFLTQLGAALTTFSRQFIDPAINSIFDPAIWVAQIIAVSKGFDAIGKTIWTFIAGAISTAASDPKAGSIAFAKMALSIMEAIGTWFEANLPTAAATVKKLISALSKSIIDLGPNILLLGKGVVNAIIKGMTEMFSADNMGKVVRSMVSGLSKAVNDAAKSIGQIGVRIASAIVKAATAFFGDSLIGRMITGRGSNDFSDLNPDGSFKIRAAGFHGIVTGPTAFMAGERGAERVDVTTRADMMTQRKPSSGGGPTTIIVYSVLDGRVVAESVARQISVNQAVYR